MYWYDYYEKGNLKALMGLYSLQFNFLRQFGQEVEMTDVHSPCVILQRLR